MLSVECLRFETLCTEATMKTTMLEKISPYYLTFPIQPIMGAFYAWPGQPIWKDDEDEDLRDDSATARLKA